MDERKFRSLFAATVHLLPSGRLRFELRLKTDEELREDEGPHGEYRLPDGDGPYRRPIAFEPWFVEVEIHPSTVSVVDKHVDERHLLYPWFRERILQLAEEHRYHRTSRHD